MDISTTGKLLKNVKRDELIKIIARLSSYDEKAEAWLLNYCQKNCAEADQVMIAQKQIQHYWDIAQEIISDANEYGGTPQEDEAYDALSEIDSLAEKTETDWTFRRSIVDEMLEQFYIGNSGFEDALMDSCMILCREKEEKLYLAGKLDHQGHYYSGVVASLYLEYGEEDQYVAVKKQNLHYGSDYIELANYYKKRKQPQKALELMETALTKADGRMDEIYVWLFDEYAKTKQEDKLAAMYKKAVNKKRNLDTIVGLMYQYYSNDYEQKKKYLLQMMDVCDAGQLRRWFDECKKVLTDLDFSKQSKYLHDVFRKRNLRGFIQLKIDEGCLHEAFEILSASPLGYYDFRGVDSGHRLTKQLADTCPEGVCDRYWKECEQLCSVSKEQNYRSAVQILKEIKGIYKKHGLMEIWNSKYSAFLERHRRKRLLMGCIESAKGL